MENPIFLRFETSVNAFQKKKKKKKKFATRENNAVVLSFKEFLSDLFLTAPLSSIKKFTKRQYNSLSLFATWYTRNRKEILSSVLCI